MGVDFFAPVFADMRSSGGARLGSYTVRITWDPAVLQYLAVEAGVFGQPVVQTDSTYYGVLMAAAISVGGLDGIVDLFRIKLHVLKAQTSAMTIQVKELSAASTFADLRGSVALVNGTFCPALGRWGDRQRRFCRQPRCSGHPHVRSGHSGGHDLPLEPGRRER